MDRARINKELDKITEGLSKDLGKKEELLNSISAIRASIAECSDEGFDNEHLLNYKDLLGLMDDMTKEAKKGKYSIDVLSSKAREIHTPLLKLGYKLSYFSLFTKGSGGSYVTIDWKEPEKVTKKVSEIARVHYLKTAEELHDISAGHKEVYIKNWLSMIAKDITKCIKECKYSIIYSVCTSINKDILDELEAMGYTTSDSSGYDISWEEPHLNTIGVSNYDYVSPEGIIPAIEARRLTLDNILKVKQDIKSKLFDCFLNKRSSNDSMNMIVDYPLSKDVIKSFECDGIHVERIEDCNYKFSW